MFEPHIYFKKYLCYTICCSYLSNFSKTKSTTILQCFFATFNKSFFNDVEKLLHTAKVWNFYFLMATWFLLTCEFRRMMLPPPQHFIRKWWGGLLCYYVCRHLVLPLCFHFRSDLSSCIFWCQSNFWSMKKGLNQRSSFAQCYVTCKENYLILWIQKKKVSCAKGYFWELDH